MITIGTWNLENLFRPGSDAGPESEATYTAKLTALAKTITELALDVLALQEIGEPEALDDLVHHLGHTWHTTLASPDGRGIRVGVLSRLPLSNIEQVVKFPDGLRPIQVDDTDTSMSAMGRPGLRVRVKTTLVDAITGLAPATGSVRFGGTELIRQKVHRIAQLGIGRTFQTASVFEELTVLQNLDIAAGAGRRPLSLLRRRSSVPSEVAEAMNTVA